jgi:hypothetical protein
VCTVRVVPVSVALNGAIAGAVFVSGPAHVGRRDRVVDQRDRAVARQRATVDGDGVAHRDRRRGEDRPAQQ